MLKDNPLPDKETLIVAVCSLPYQTLFNAIAAATKPEAGGVSISVTAFRAALASTPEEVSNGK
jgi:hypothetical protein